MSSSVVPFDKLKLDSIVGKPPRQFGKAKLVFLEPRTNIVTPKLQVAWPIKPSSDEGGDKYSLEISMGSVGEENDDELSFKASISAFDMRIRQLAFANKKSWFGKEADQVSSEADLRLMHTMCLKKGNEKQDGSRYSDTVKFKVTGWQNYQEEILYRGEGENRFPSDVRWKTRPVTTPQGQGGPDDNQTKFYICESTDPTTGKEQMVPWTPCQDPAGNEIKDALGNPTYEFVGPKHCQPGCKIRVVFQPTMVWLASKFGVTLHAKQVFITPAAPKAKAFIDGLEIKDCVDPILAKKAVRLALSNNNGAGEFDEDLGTEFATSLVDLADLNQGPNQDQGASKPAPTTAERIRGVTSSQASEDAASTATTSKSKRPAEESASSPKGKSKKVKVDEEF